MDIDTVKLEDHINRGLQATKEGWLSEETVIGEIGGKQILLKITADEDEIINRPQKRHFCISDDPK